MLKGNKGDGDFQKKANQFYLDVGWIRLTKMLDFNKMMDDFKSVDNDPRELVLLYKNLLGTDKASLSRHFDITEFKFDL